MITIRGWHSPRQEQWNELMLPKLNPQIKKGNQKNNVSKTKAMQSNGPSRYGVDLEVCLLTSKVKCGIISSRRLQDEELRMVRIMQQYCNVCLMCRFWRKCLPHWQYCVVVINRCKTWSPRKIEHRKIYWQKWQQKWIGSCLGCLAATILKNGIYRKLNSMQDFS